MIRLVRALRLWKLVGCFKSFFGSTKGLSDSKAAEGLSRKVLSILGTMEVGGELGHLKELTRMSDKKGSDVNLISGEFRNNTAQVIPYPSFAWRLVPVQSYVCHNVQHINVLEYLVFASTCAACVISRLIMVYDLFLLWTVVLLVVLFLRASVARSFSIALPAACLHFSWLQTSTQCPFGLSRRGILRITETSTQSPSGLSWRGVLRITAAGQLPRLDRKVVKHLGSSVG